MASKLPTLQDVQGLPDPAQNWSWTLDVLLNDKFLVPGLRVMEVNFPFTYLEPVSRPRGSSFLYFPGHSNIDGPQVSMYETQDFAVLRAFEYWQSLVKDADGNYGIPKDYLGECILRHYDDRGNVRMECVLLGCWPTRLTDWPLNYQGSNHLTVQVQFAANDSDMTFYSSAGTKVTSGFTF